MTWAATSVKAASRSAGDMSFVASSAWATICGTPVISAGLKTPPCALQLATRGSRLYQTGCDVPPHGSDCASSC
jgi:hypothetical protein